jgi:hypothetical protein
MWTRTRRRCFISNGPPKEEEGRREGRRDGRRFIDEGDVIVCCVGVVGRVCERERSV